MVNSVHVLMHIDVGVVHKSELQGSHMTLLL